MTQRCLCPEFSYFAPCVNVLLSQYALRGKTSNAVIIHETLESSYHTIPCMESSWSCNFNFRSIHYPLLSHLQLKSRINLAPADLGEGELGVRLNDPDAVGAALGSIARSRLALVQPGHVAASVPPDAHGQHHTTGQGLAHTDGTTQPEHWLGTSGLAELVVDVVDLGVVVDVDGGVLDHLAVLDVQAVDALKLAALVGGELRDDGKGAVGVDGHVARVTVVVVVGDTVRVVSAAGLVADALARALGALALSVARDVARVRDQRGGAGVSLPDVHLVAASSVAVDVALCRRG